MKKGYTFLALLIALQGQTQPGFLDSSFGVGGKVIAQDPGLNALNENVLDLLVQADGRIVTLYSSGPQGFNLVRHLSNGSVDSSFGINGFISHQYYFFPVAAALQADGKILVSGNEPLGGTDVRFSVFRFLPNGLPDYGFGNAGNASVNFTFSDDRVAAMAVQGDGKIVLVGYAFKETDRRSFAAARFLPNGAADAGFGTDGKVVHDLGDHFYRATAVALQGDGKIVFGGYSNLNGNKDFGLGRMNEDGSRDAMFGDNGTLLTDFGLQEELTAIAIQTDGKILAAGTISQSLGSDFALARYHTDGSLDYSFSGDGKQITDIGTSLQTPETRDIVADLRIQADGGILVAGTTNYDPSVTRQNFAVIRYNVGGSLDPSFSGDGIQVSTFLGNYDFAKAIELQSDAKLVVAGNSLAGSIGLDYFAIARYNTNGSLDNTFSDDGKVLGFTPDLLNQIAFSAITVHSDGKIIAAGHSGRFGAHDFLIMRYNPDGTPDTSFSEDGRETTDLGSNDEAHGVALQEDGKIVVVGAIMGNDNADLAIVRYNANGSLDQTFSTDGKQIVDFGAYDIANAVALQKDDKIVIGGTTTITGTTSNSRFALVRISTNGEIDETFGDHGKVSTDFSDMGYTTARLNSLAIDANGKIVSAGGNKIARYNLNGILDISFSGDGRLVYEASPGQPTIFSPEAPSAIAIQNDGKIILAGRGVNTSTNRYDFALVRFRNDGMVDASFDNDGFLFTDISGSDDQAYAVGLQSNGKIIAAGISQKINTVDKDFSIVRYNPDGSLDNTFGNDGKQLSDFSAFDAARALNIHGSRLYIAGELIPGAAGVVAAYQLEELKPVLTINDVDIDRSEQWAILTVKLSKKTDRSVVLFYETIDGTAKHGQDYFKQQGTIIFQQGETSKTISIRLNKNKKKEIAEYFDVQLYTENVTNDLILQDLSGRVTIEAGSNLKDKNKNHRIAEVPVQNFSVTIAPNPSTKSFRLYFSGNIAEKLFLKIYDASGRIVETKQVQGINSIVFGQNYRAGIYYVQITSNGLRKIIKLIKLPS